MQSTLPGSIEAEPAYCAMALTTLVFTSVLMVQCVERGPGADAALLLERAQPDQRR